MAQPADTLRIALGIASAGLPVFPCGKTKKPSISRDNGGHGFHDAVTDPDAVRALFGRAKASLVGVPTGEVSGFDVLDLDYRHGAGAWEDENRHRLPCTRVHQTQSGGRHMLFRHVHGVRNLASKFAPGMDVRGDGGYIIMPPSIGYTVIDESPIAEWPDWLLAIILKEKEAAQPTFNAPPVVSTNTGVDRYVAQVLANLRNAAEGQKHFRLRNAALTLGGLQHRTGDSTQQITDQLLNALPKSVKDWNGAKDTIAWGIEQGRQKPITLQERLKPNGHHAAAVPREPEPIVLPAELDADPTPPRANNWRDTLARSDKGKILPTASNALTIISSDPQLQGSFARNVFTAETVLTRPLPAAVSDLAPQAAGYPRQWTESDIFLMQAYLHRFYSTGFSFEMAHRAMTAAAAASSFHPVLQWLELQIWDRKPRIDNWLVNAFNCENTPYVQAIGSKFLIAAVRRVRSPGCQHDTMLVIEGPQGIRKSSAFRCLFGDAWFTDDMPHDLKNKDSPQALLGMWGVEFSEVAQVTSSKAEVETTKAFLSRRVDRFRPPYGRGFITQPRQSVFIGTTNRTDWLVDETGNRRFLPAYGNLADTNWIATNRDQLWAEAAQREANGESIWLDDGDIQNLATIEQEKRMEDDPWTSATQRYLSGKTDPVEVGDILTGIGVPISQQDKRAQMRVGRILKAVCWTRLTTWDANTKKMHKNWSPPKA